MGKIQVIDYNLKSERDSRESPGWSLHQEALETISRFHQEKDLIIFAFYRDYTGSNGNRKNTLFVKKEQDVRRELPSAIILSKI